MNRFPIALQLYSVRGQMHRDFEGTLKAVSEMGYDGVEFAGLFGRTAEEVKALLEKYSLTAVSAHIPLSEMTADPEGVFATYQKIGCRYAAVPYLGAEDRPGTPGFTKVLENIRMISEKAKEYGIQMMYHNHDFEFVKMESGNYGFDEIYSTIPAELLTAEIDTCWVNVAGEDPAEYVRKYAGRVPVLHLKDFVMPGKKPERLYALIGLNEEDAPDKADAFSFRPVGYGAQNMPEILRAATDAGCLWVVVEQDDPSMGKSSMECAKMSIDYLKDVQI